MKLPDVIKCPICNKEAMYRFKHKPNQHYFLCTVDTGFNPANIMVDNGIPVDAYGCNDCGTMILNSPKIIGCLEDELFRDY